MAGVIKRKIIRPIRNTFLYGVFKSMFHLIPLLPRKIVLKWHEMWAKVAYKFAISARKTIQKNITIAFDGLKTPEESYQMGKDLFIELAQTFTDYAYFAKFKTRKQFAKYFNIEGEEHLKQAYERGQGVLCLITHTPGWEFSAIMPPTLGYKTIGVSSRIKNPALNQLMIQKRESRGMKNITREHCYDTLVDYLKKGYCLVIMIDQDSMNIKGDFLNFFGHQAYTPIGCSRLAKETGAAIVPMCTYCENNHTYTFKIYPEIPYITTGNEKDDILTNTQIQNNIIEKMILAHPEQWVWMHRRWNTTPESLNEFLQKKATYKKQMLLNNQ